MILSQIWEHVIEAKATVDTLGYLLGEFAIRFFESDFAIGLFGTGATFETVKEKYALLPYLLMLFGLLEAFFGRRFFKTQKFFFGFIVGFAIGAVYVAPEISNIVQISPVVIGLAFGIVLALFRSPLYWTTLGFTVFYLIYYRLINNLGFVKFIAVAVSLLLAAFILIFLVRWVELVGTSLLGGWIFASVLMWNTDFSDTSKSVIITVVTVIIGILGFAVQFIHDRRVRKKKREEI